MEYRSHEIAMSLPLFQWRRHVIITSNFVFFFMKPQFKNQSWFIFSSFFFWVVCKYNYYFNFQFHGHFVSKVLSCKLQLWKLLLVPKSQNWEGTCFFPLSNFKTLGIKWHTLFLHFLKTIRVSRIKWLSNIVSNFGNKKS